MSNLPGRRPNKKPAVPVPTTAERVVIYMILWMVLVLPISGAVAALVLTLNGSILEAEIVGILICAALSVALVDA